MKLRFCYMSYIKIPTFFLLFFIIINGCSKDDGEIDSDVLATIQSPHIIDALLEQKDNFGGQIDKNDIESLTELKLTLNVNKLSKENCQWQFDYNLEENNLLEGLEQFKSLKKLVLVIRPNLSEDNTNFNYENYNGGTCFKEENEPLKILIEKLENLEELYVSFYYINYSNDINFEVANCPKLKKIGTANPFVGIVNYPTEETITMDNSNFLEENPSYEKFEPYVGSDESDEASFIFSLLYNTQLHLENLSNLESLHLFHSPLRGITKNNSPKLKKLFYFKKRGELGTGGWLFDPALLDIEEFYFDYQYYSPFPSYDPQTLDLSGFSKLNKLYYKFWFPGGERNSVPPGSKLRVQNGTNMQNNLEITVDFEKYGSAFQQGDPKRFVFCLDEDITEEFKNNNITVKSVNGVEGFEALTSSCE
ncbi:hypothetical protein [Maribacter sp. 2308TA10-17]|uniref:hypothetical protein n=1 Tax=Maribacter sp. 2308TA10-17 TaxID=3386276 RepID=UPI0039BCE996